MTEEPAFRASGKASAWWWLLPREGEVVPDYPPVELTGLVGDVQIEHDPADLPSWAERLATTTDEPLTMWIGDPPDGPCTHCERCTWNPGPDCGKAEHPHCPTCGHCEGRHG